MSHLGDPAVYVKFFGGVLNLALFPDVPRQQYVAWYGSATKRGAWMWAPHQVRENLGYPERANLALLDSIVAVFSLVLRRVPRCHSPPYIAPTAIPDLYVMQ